MAFRFSCELTLTERPYQTGSFDTAGKYHVYDGVDSTWEGTVYQLFPGRAPADVCALHQNMRPDHFTILLSRRIASIEEEFCGLSFAQTSRDSCEAYKRTRLAGMGFFLHITKYEKPNRDDGWSYWLECERVLYPVQITGRGRYGTQKTIELTVYDPQPSERGGALCFEPMAVIRETGIGKNRWGYDIRMRSIPDQTFYTAVFSLILSVFQEPRDRRELEREEETWPTGFSAN